MKDIALNYLKKALSGLAAGFVTHLVFLGPY